MISLRQILVIVVVTMGIWLIKHLHTRFNKTFAGKRDELSASTTGYQDMVPCKRCGTHILRGQATGNEKDGYFCDDLQCASNNKI